MMDTKIIAEELMRGDLDVSDLIADVSFLKEVDQSLITLVNDLNWSDAQIARKRQQLMDRIATVLNQEEENVSSIQRVNRFKR